VAVALPVTTIPPFAERAKTATARSISPSRIRQEHRPIRYQLPARLSFR
jgi:hypothetical protein